MQLLTTTRSARRAATVLAIGLAAAVVPAGAASAEPAAVFTQTAFSATWPGPDLARTVGQLLWYSGAAVVVVTGWALRRRESTRVMLDSLAAGAVAAVCGAAVILAQDGRALQPGFVVNWQCEGRAPQLCLHPAVRAARPALAAQIDPIAARLAGTPFALSRVEQRPRGPGSIPSPGAVAFGLDDTRPESVRLAGQDVAVNAFGFQDNCFTDNGPKDGYFLAQLLASWPLATCRPSSRERRRRLRRNRGWLPALAASAALG